MSLLTRLLGPPEPSSQEEHRRRHPRFVVDPWTDAVEPVHYLGAAGILALTGIAAIFGAPFDRREVKPAPPRRLHPQNGSCAGGGD